MFDGSDDSLSRIVRLPQKVTRQTRVIKSSSIVKCTRPRFLNPKLKHHHFCYASRADGASLVRKDLSHIRRKSRTSVCKPLNAHFKSV